MVHSHRLSCRLPQAHLGSSRVVGLVLLLVSLEDMMLSQRVWKVLEKGHSHHLSRCLLLTRRDCGEVGGLDQESVEFERLGLFEVES
jgi:hypothetical protein